MTTGAPITEVIALIGKVMSFPGTCAMVSQQSITIAPTKSVLQNNTK